MSMRPLDLQTVVPRVTEAARAERIGQQGQEKTAAETAGRNQEAARKGSEEVAARSSSSQQRPIEHRDESRVKDEFSQAGGRRRGREGASKGDSGRRSGAAKDAGTRPTDGRASPADGEPGHNLDILM